VAGKGSVDWKLPLVLLVHGGPWRRSSWGSSAGITQWLANRGYAVLNVNFRGSVGYGKAFSHKGECVVTVAACIQKYGCIMQRRCQPADIVAWCLLLTRPAAHGCCSQLLLLLVLLLLLLCWLQVTVSGVWALCSTTCQMQWPGQCRQASLTQTACASWGHLTGAMQPLQVRIARVRCN
jgi:hypothetical protein